MHHVPDHCTFLNESELDHEAGLSQLLDEAQKLARSQPNQARQLTILCAKVAEKVDGRLVVSGSLDGTIRLWGVVGE